MLRLAKVGAGNSDPKTMRALSAGHMEDNIETQGRFGSVFSFSEVSSPSRKQTPRDDTPGEVKTACKVSCLVSEFSRPFFFNRDLMGRWHLDYGAVVREKREASFLSYYGTVVEMPSAHEVPDFDKS